MLPSFPIDRPLFFRALTPDMFVISSFQHSISSLVLKYRSKESVVGTRRSACWSVQPGLLGVLHPQQAVQPLCSTPGWPWVGLIKLGRPGGASTSPCETNPIEMQYI